MGVFSDRRPEGIVDCELWVVSYGLLTLNRRLRFVSRGLWGYVGELGSVGVGVF